MRRFQHTVIILALSLALGACVGTSSSGSGSDPEASGPSYYYDEFADVALPKEMRGMEKRTFITRNADGTKIGTQEYRGRVELGSLVTAMQSYMLRDGWTLRSIFRSDRSILIFERPDRMCSIYIDEGAFETVMLVFVASKLNDGALQYSVPPATSTPLTDKNSNVTTYPAEQLPQ